MAKNQAKMQMVEDDEVENVGIMSGFMDDIEELMEEIAQQEMAGEGDDADMARILGRSPNSPEVLMNNLRGDYRSIDARREELADRVGYNAAQQTPDEVLAMLQPILAQQGIAALPMGGADVGALPMDAMTGMPPAGMPPAAMPMDPAMMGAPPAGMPPMDPAMMAQMPPEGIASLPMDQGAMPPLQMARGGIVQHFERGGAAASATKSISPIDEYLAQRPQAAIDPMVRTRELTPEYQELLGISDRGATQAQMLFDIAQAALGYASNVGPDGQRLSGSQAARLAGATRALPGQIGARAAAMRDDETRARLAALQQAQSEQAAVQASNTALSDNQRAILLAREAQANELANRARYRMATPEELAALGNPTGLVQYDATTGKFEVSRDPVTNINTGGGKLSDVLSTNAANLLDASYTQANAALGTLNTINNVRPLLDENLFSGPLSGSAMFVSQLGQSLGVGGETSQEMLQNTVVAMQGLAEFELLAAQAMRGQGALSDKERALIARASAGDLGSMNQGQVKELIDALEKTANYRIQSHQNTLARYTDVLKDDPASTNLLGLYQLGNAPIMPVTTGEAQPSEQPAAPAIIPPDMTQINQERIRRGLPPI
jgi:hypothetical protein